MERAYEHPQLGPRSLFSALLAALTISSATAAAYTFKQVAPGLAPVAQGVSAPGGNACSLPWGGTLADGATYGGVAYSQRTVLSPADCSSVAVTETCTNGKLSAPTAVNTCSVTPADPNYAQVVLLMHMDGANGSTTLVDEKGTAISNTGATLSTTQVALGTSSLAVTSGQRVTFSAANMSYPGDFTEELFVYYTGGPVSYLDTWTSSGGRQFFVNNGSLYYYYNGNASIHSATMLTTNTWHHLAATRSGTTVRLFLDGVNVASIANISGALNSAQALTALNFQQSGGPTDYAGGYIDEVRVTKGYARYTANFTPPSAPFPNQ